MTSKISYFKIALDDLRHRTWMLALSCIGNLLALPIFFLFFNAEYIEFYTRDLGTLQEAREFLVSSYVRHLQSYTTVTCGIILFVGALIVGLFGYRYVYSGKMVDLYHSLPVKREALFLIHYIDGFLIWLIPMLISYGITLLLILVNMIRYQCAASFGVLLSVAGKQILLFLLAFLTVYNFTLVCVMLSGNAFNAICLTCMGGVLIAGLWALNAVYSDAFLSTYVTPRIALQQLSFASPLVNAIVILVWNTNYSIVSGNGFFLGMSLCMILVNFVVSLLLYRSRPSELAGRGIENRLVQHVIRVSISCAAGLSLAYIFILIMYPLSYGWITFGIILGTFLAFGVLNVIFHMDFRAFLKHKRELLLTIVAAGLLLIGYRFDVTGYNTRLPRQSDITAASYMIGSLSENPYSSNAYLHYEDTTKLYALLEALTDEAHLDGSYDEPDGYSFSYIAIFLQKKNGSLFCRSYKLYSTDIELLRDIVEDNGYRETYYPISSGLADTPDDMAIECSLAAQTYLHLTAEERAVIMDAYCRDFRNHYSLDELVQNVDVCTLRIGYTGEPTLRLSVPANYTETIAAILRFYPGCPIVSENLNVSAIELAPEVATTLPWDALYSYFALDGYPSYDDYLEEYTSKWEVPAYDGTDYRLLIDDPDEMDRLYPYLTIGSLHTEYLSYMTNQYRYIHLGSLVLANGNRIPCYVGSGELPREWIDRLEIVPVDDTLYYTSDDYYNDYDYGYTEEYYYY